MRSKDLISGRRRVLALSLLTGAAALFGVSTAHAAPFLAVDFNASNSTANTQTGFTAWNGTTTSGNSAGATDTRSFTVPTSTVLSGSVSVRVAGIGTVGSDGLLDGSGKTVSFQARTSFADNSGTGFSYADLYRDFIFATTQGDGNTFVQFYGLDPNTQYKFRFYVADPNNAKISKITDVTNNSVLGSVTVPAAQATPNTYTISDNDQYSVVGTGTTDSAGRILFRDDATTTTLTKTAATINGLTIEAVPEPASLATIGIGAGMLLAGRRRRSPHD